jgi:hypothetical protein
MDKIDRILAQLQPFQQRATAKLAIESATKLDLA